jgi:hypothetical protein
MELKQELVLIILGELGELVVTQMLVLTERRNLKLAEIIIAEHG